MSELFKNLKRPIENAFLLLGMVLISLGFFTLYFSIPILISNLYNGWPWTVNACVLLAVGLSLTYIEVKLSKIEL